MPPAGAPGTNSRGRGSKFRKFTRGGGKQFSRDLRPLDDDGNEISMWSIKAGQKPGDKDDDEGEDDDESGDDDDDDDDDDKSGRFATQGLPPGSQDEPESRESRKEAKKARKSAAIARSKTKAVQVGDMPSDDDEDSSDDADEILPANPNHSRAARKQTVAFEDEEEPSAPLAAPAVANGIAKLDINERRDEDLARLNEIKRKREEAARFREAEQESKSVDEHKKPAAQRNPPGKSRK